MSKIAKDRQRLAKIDKDCQRSPKIAKDCQILPKIAEYQVYMTETIKFNNFFWFLYRKAKGKIVTGLVLHYRVNNS